MASKITLNLLTCAVLFLGSPFGALAQGTGDDSDGGWWIGVALGLGTGILGFLVYKLRQSSKGKEKKQKKYINPIKAAIALIVAVMLGCIAMTQLTHMSKVKKIEEKKPVKKTVTEKGFKLDKLPFIQAKTNHETALVRKDASPDEYDNDAPENVKVVHFTSEGRQLLAWVLRPKSKGKHPAVLYCHDGGALKKSDVKNAMPFLEAGFIVMLPAWRGENGNSGYQELCYGEVEDAANAVDYLSQRKAVDSSNIFVFGHGVGATIAMLLAQTSFKVKKVAACSGYPNMFKTGSYANAPFKKSKTELRLRSPAMYVRDINCPILLMYGDQGKAETLYYKQAKEMDKEGSKHDKKIRVKLFTYSDHEDVLEEAIPMSIRLFSKGLELRPDQKEETEQNSKDVDSEEKSEQPQEEKEDSN